MGPPETIHWQYYGRHQGEFVYLLVHVDDCLVVGNSAGVKYATDVIKSLFDVKDMGAVYLFLGLDVIRDRATRALWLGQPRYIASMLKQYGMLDCKRRIAPLDTGLQLSKDGEHLDAGTPYNALVGSLLDLAICTRPDIADAVGMLSRFVSFRF
jgi:Reverse transcriptase (RNA-dependent DNA polymerase)